jgi:aldehyde:ferredoxin oxidoreductase
MTLFPGDANPCFLENALTFAVGRVKGSLSRPRIADSGAKSPLTGLIVSGTGGRTLTAELIMEERGEK